MCAVELACAVADPEEVRGGGVVGMGGAGRVGVLEVSEEALFVFEEESLMACVDIDSLDAAVSVDAYGLHESQGVFDAIDDPGVFLPDGGGDDVPETPVERGVQVGKT